MPKVADKITETIKQPAQVNPDALFPDFITWNGPAPGQAPVAVPLILYARNNFMHGPGTVGIPENGFGWQALRGTSTYLNYGPYLHNIASGYFEVSMSIRCPDLKPSDDNSIVAFIDIFDGALSPNIAFASKMITGRKCRSNLIYKLPFKLPAQADFLEARIFTTGAATVQTYGIEWRYYGQDPSSAQPAPAVKPTVTPTVVSLAPFSGSTGNGRFTYNLSSEQIANLNAAIPNLQTLIANQDKQLGTYPLAGETEILRVKEGMGKALASLGFMINYVNSPGYSDSRGHVRAAYFNALQGYVAVQAMIYNDLSLNHGVAGVPAFTITTTNFDADYPRLLARVAALRQQYDAQFNLQFLNNGSKSASDGFAYLGAAINALVKMPPTYAGARIAAINAMLNAQSSLCDQFDLPH